MTIATASRWTPKSDPKTEVIVRSARGAYVSYEVCDTILSCKRTRFLEHFTPVIQTRTTTVTAILENALRHLNQCSKEIQDWDPYAMELYAIEDAYTIIRQRYNEIVWTINDTLVSMEAR